MKGKRIISLTAAVLLAVTTFFSVPQMASVAYADNGDPAMSLGSGTLQENVNTPDARVLWYGDNSWYVIGCQPGVRASLLSKSNIGSPIYFNDSSNREYGRSNLKIKIDEQGDKLSDIEKSSVVTKTLYPGTFDMFNVLATDGVVGGPYEDQLMWPLTTKEAASVNYTLRKADPEHQNWVSSCWWLGSPGASANNGVVYVSGNGDIEASGKTPNLDQYGVRPGFYLDLPSVLFTSAATSSAGGKSSGIVGANALKAVEENTSNEWKLTLKDPERDFDVTKVKPTENGFTVTYTGAKTGENEYISAIVKKENGDITKYGRIANVSDASGEVTITTAGKLEEGERLYVFNEQYNGDKKSDSASELKEIVAPQSIMVEVGQNHGTAAADLEAALDDYLTDGSFPALTEIYTEDSTIHIDFPLFEDYTNGDILNLLKDAVWEKTGVSYGDDRNRKEIGYQSSYESGDDYIADLTGKENSVLENGQRFYLLWDKPVKSVNVTVNDTPQCGFTVTGDRAASQTPKPDYTITEDGIDPDGHACYWWTTSSADAGEGTYYAGTAKGGDEMNVFVSLQAKYGYYFDFDSSPITCKLNDSPAKDVRGGEGALMFTGTIPVKHVWSDTQRVDTPATCTEAGEKSRYCTVCSDSDPDGIETIPALGHDWGAWMKVSDSEHQRVCATDSRHIEQKPHNWDNGVITKEPTATAEGEKTYTCIDCKAKKTEPVPVKEPGVDPNQKGSDGTAVGPGASAAAADKAITSMKKDADPKGTAFSKLRLKSTKQTKKSVKLSWTKVSKAKKYVIYGNKCGKANKPKKLATVTGNTKNFTKVAGKKIKKGTYYKFIMVALDKDNNVISTSRLIHVATKGGKVGNHKSVTVKKSVLKKARKLKKGKSLSLKAKAVAQSKKLKVKKHVKVRFESTNKKIATVSTKGVVKGKKKGTCYVYAYAQNGVYKKIKVVVK